MSLFFNSNDDLRSGWRFALYVAVFLVTFVALKYLLETSFQNTLLPSITVLALQILVLFVSAVVALLFMVRFVDHLPLSAFGIGLYERWPRDVFLGVAVSTGMLAGLLMGGAVVGGVEIVWTVSEISLGVWTLTVAILLVSGAAEEMIFRGYPMQVLMKGIGIWPAMLVMSVLFGMLHTNNPDASRLSTANTIVAGLMLSLAYLRTRSLLFPYGIHIAWNLGIGPIIGFPISGVRFPSLWTARMGGPAAIVGGVYGPEGGILGTLIFFCGFLAVRTIVRVQVSPRIRATIAQNAGKLYASDLTEL